MHCRLRYFDPLRRRAGIPSDVAALIDTMTDTFEPSKYKDDYYEKVMEVIQAKVAGVRPQAVAGAPKAPGKVVDLMEVLKQSLEETQKKEPVTTRSRKARSAVTSAPARSSAWR